MTTFARALEERQTDPSDRLWLYVPYDQLGDTVGPLSREDPERLGIVLVENRFKAGRRPYHQQKLAWVLASMRHFALEQAERGVAVRYVAGDAPYATLLEPLAGELGPLRVMRPAEHELRADLAPLFRKGRLEEIPHEGWLTTREQFDAAFAGGKRWRMDGFYRHVRRETGILMDDDRPRGGKFSFDTENRRAWKGDPPAPKPLGFPPDDVVSEVLELVRRDFGHHPGELVPDQLPARAADAERLWRWARRNCLASFGPYQDAMSFQSRTLFHTLTSSLLNNGRLSAARLVRDVARMDLPLASQEGFIRQVLGWREFMHHVHDATNGFRQLPDGQEPPRAARPGDAGYRAWSGRRWKSSRAPARLDGGACPSVLDAQEPVPPAFWGKPSGLACLDRSISNVWETGYGHHIERLMVIANLATLIGISPRALTDWFWIAYTDAYDWVVEPNVLGMGSFGLGDLFTTKPYVSGAAYIHRMSDSCDHCAFSPKRDCPVTSLYWSFLDRNRDALSGNARVQMPLRSAARRSDEKRAHDRAVTGWVRETLAAGRELEPADAPPLDS